ncbi:MAG TPA: serine hydrolase domain-containing protein [Allosphingosinicella sp.]|nr:serine hydrolase domain-containing protein [Allosphingosinicella sp.]
MILTLRMFGFAALLGIILFGARAASAQPADLRARADEILESAYPADGPGAVVVVTRGGRTVYTAGRGLADVEAGTPIRADSLFRLGSITKQFTAAAILQLVQAGRISVDDPISRFFPDYPQPAASATVRQLLNHTSGIQSYTAIPGWMVEANTSRARTTAEMMALVRDLPPRTPPGEAWAYNNSGYVLLGAIIERVTGRPWYRAVERMTGRLGIRGIGYGAERESSPRMVRGYTVADGRVVPAPRIHMSVPHGAGGLVGSVGDLARWAHALHRGRVLSPQLYEAMTTPANLTGGRTHPYGFGVRFDRLRDRETIEHGGAIFGFNTESIYIPSEDVFVAVLANSDGPTTAPALVARRLAALAIGEPYRAFTRAVVDPASLAPLFGIYRIGDGATGRRFFSRDGRLYTMRDDGSPEREVFAAGDDHFFYPGSFNWFRVVRRADGAHVMEMHQGGEDSAELSTRAGDIPTEAPAAQVGRAILESYVGRYATEGPAAEVAMGADGMLTIQLEGQPAIPLRARSESEFEIAGVGATIVFHAENGTVNRFVIRQGGRELEGRRVVR